MKIVLIGPAYPYRGGIATFVHSLAAKLTARGERVSIETFSLQYPSSLFPGKTQFADGAPPQGLSIKRAINSINPFNWIKIGKRLSAERPDMVVMKYWTPFLAPCLGTIARLARKNGHTKVVVHLDNITPHEKHVTDRLLNRYFLQSADSFVYMSDQVGTDLRSFTDRPAVFSPHPIYEIYGRKIERKEACEELHLDPALRYVLFFGIVRAYKGLDLLLEAWRIFIESCGSGYRLIVAGEFYDDRKQYDELVSRLGIANSVIIHDSFIADEQVKYYFSAADLLAQTYRTATQSGVTQIAYNFDLPMIVTRVGGLSEIVNDNISGFVTDTEPRAIAEALKYYFSPGTAERLKSNMPQEKNRFSWDATADAIMQAYKMAAEEN